MSSFWPSGLTLSDTQSPREILKAAQEDWEKDSDGVMSLVLQDAKSESGNSMIIVHAKHVASNRTATLFSVVHRPEHPYPATIQQKEEELPKYLKKSYVRGGFGSILDLTGSQEKIIQNPWVSDTPSEFRKNLSNSFNLGYVKSEILNLVAISGGNTDSIKVESPETLEER